VTTEEAQAAITLAQRALRQLCREAGIGAARSRMIEADLADLMLRVAAEETSEQQRAWLEATAPRRPAGVRRRGWNPAGGR
jgi:hypothetical protein